MPAAALGLGNVCHRQPEVWQALVQHYHLWGTKVVTHSVFLQQRVQGTPGSPPA